MFYREPKSVLETKSEVQGRTASSSEEVLLKYFLVCLAVGSKLKICCYTPENCLLIATLVFAFWAFLFVYWLNKGCSKFVLKIFPLYNEIGVLGNVPEKGDFFTS